MFFIYRDKLGTRIRSKEHLKMGDEHELHDRVDGGGHNLNCYRGNVLFSNARSPPHRVYLPIP